jgi:hypothetical protein
MKPVLLSIALILTLSLANVIAQAPNNSEAIKHEMKKIAYMAGQWTGEAMVKRGNTPPIKVMQEENVQFKLDGTVLFIEGIGKNPENKSIAFNALAIVSYNPYTKQFGIKSHTLEGNQTEGYFKIIAENHFEWGFETPTKAKIKFDIVLDPQAKTWVEKGEYSPDGVTWYPTIELKLTKVE